MSETKHTPLPWEIHNLTDIFTRNGATNAAGVQCDDNDGWLIADCALGVTMVHGEEGDLPSSEQQENTKFIVRACNAHYALIQALEGTLGLLTDAMEHGITTSEGSPDILDVLKAADDAISKAKDQ